MTSQVKGTRLLGSWPRRLCSSVEQQQQGDTQQRQTCGLDTSVRQLDGLLDHLQSIPGWPDLVLDELQERLLVTLPSVRDRLQNLLTASRVRLEDLPSSLKERYLAPDGRVRLEVFPSQVASKGMEDNLNAFHAFRGKLVLKTTENLSGTHSFR